MASDSKSGSGGDYVFLARSVPIYIALLPVAIAIGVWFPDAPILERIGAVVVSPAVLAMLLTQVARDPGRRKQPALWESWGGPLLEQYLRHRNTDINEHLRQQYHRKLQELLPHLKCPSAAEEEADPEAADQIYAAYAQHLVTVVREDTNRFPSAFKENRNYGFRRNLWGLRPLGLFCSLAATLSLGLWLYIRWDSLETQFASWLIAVLVCGGLAAIWIFVVTPAWVKIPSDAYARRVLEYLPVMGEEHALP